METEPQDSKTDLGKVQKGRGGFICDRGERVLPSVLLSITLSPGQGHTHDAVAEGPPVYFFPVEDFVTGAAHDQKGEGQCC